MGIDFLDLLGENGSKKFLVRDFRNASQLVPGVNPPRQKFEGYVNFILNRDIFDKFKDTHNFRKEISSLIRTADLPSVVFQTETKNQYNKKKIVNTGVTYNPVGITVFDTVGNEWLTTLMKYFSYHFMDPRNLQKGDDRDIAGHRGREGGLVNMKDGFDSNATGYNLNASAQFFERIDYVLYHGRKGVQYSIFNPVMTNFKPGGIDYSSSEVQEFSMEFEYERFTVFNELNFALGDEDLSRFESIAQLSGDLFEEDLPEVMKTSRTLKLLGTEDADKRDRSAQPAYTTTPGNPDSETIARSAEEATYAASNTGTRSAGAKDSSGSIFKDILGDVADSALSAVLRGQNVKDAIVSTAVAKVSTAVGEAINENVSSEDQIKTP